MCLGIPGQVIAVQGKSALVEFWGVRKTVGLDVLTDPVVPGDYVLNHSGFAVRVIAPEAVAERCGIPAPRIRALAAELAQVAFDQAIEIAQPWTDFRGDRHDRMVGRPALDREDAPHRRQRR